MNVLNIVKKILLLVALISFAPVLNAESLGINVIAMFPQNTAELGYMNLKEARKFQWYGQFKFQSLPPRFLDLERFLDSAGADSNQIEELAWSLEPPENISGDTDKAVPDSERVLGVALGNFDTEASKSYLRAHKISGIDYRSFTLYGCAACRDLAVVFIDSSTIAFGTPQLLRQLIEVRAGADDSLIQNEKLFPLITQINGRGIFWGVLNAGGTRQALKQMAPQAAQFPQASKLLSKLTGMVISIQGTSDLEVHLQLRSSSPEASVTISQLLQAGVLLRQFEAKISDPDLATLLGAIRIAPNGEGVEASFAASNDQIVSLIKQNAFSAKRQRD
jgi:hypothetical protein